MPARGSRKRSRSPEEDSDSDSSAESLNIIFDKNNRIQCDDTLLDYSFRTYSGEFPPITLPRPCAVPTGTATPSTNRPSPPRLSPS